MLLTTLLLRTSTATSLYLLLKTEVSLSTAQIFWLARIATLEDIVTSQSSLINTLLLRVNDANSSLALEANVDVFTCTLTFASGGPLFTGTFSAGDCGGHLPPTNDYIPVIVSGTIGNCWDYHRHDFSTLPNYKIESQSGPCEGPIVIIVKFFK